jgi:predicted RNA binding protein YcfA (HicA-like mRNA interferase family)
LVVWQEPQRLAHAAAMKVSELVDRLRSDGWVLVRLRGSHRQYRHPVKAGTVTVSGKSSADIPIGTLKSALKQAGLLRKE